MKESIFSVVTLVGLLVIGCSVMAFTENKMFVGEILVSFRFQYLWILLLAAIVNLYQKQKLFVAVFSVFALLNAAIVVPTWTNKTLNEQLKHSFFYANVLSENTDYGSMLELIKKQDSDFVVLVEVTPKWDEAMSGITMIYPYKVVFPRKDNFGIAFYSKWPIEDHEIFSVTGAIESIYAKVKINNSPLHIVATHPFPPENTELWKLRNQQFSDISQYLKKLTGKKILVGDFNAVPWSKSLNQFINDVNLSPIKSLNDTWPAFLPVGFRIKLDYFMLSEELTGSVTTLENVGSDHLPLLLKF